MRPTGDAKAAAPGAQSSEWVVLADLDEISHEAARRFVALSNACNPCTVALSGGSTPRLLYGLLSIPPYRDQTRWDRIHVIWGDERCVPPDHPDSNYRMARETLLDKVPIPRANIHRIQGELHPCEAASRYEGEIESVLGPTGRLDLVLLGMGDDGHTASLFPGTTALAERARSAVAEYVPRLQSWRVTLTLPTFNAARQILFLVGGESKAPALSRIRAGEALPAGQVQPTAGHLAWLIDRAAAGSSWTDSPMY